MVITVSVEARPIRGIPRRSITRLSAANKTLWLGLKDAMLLRFTNNEIGPVSDSPKSAGYSDVGGGVALKPKDGELHSEVRELFVDSKSFHCLVCLGSGENWYSNFQFSNLSYLGSLQKVYIRSAAYTEATSEDATGPFLIGTQRGTLIEGSISIKPFRVKFKPLFAIADREPILAVELVPVICNGTRTFVIIALTTRKLYEFYGGVTFAETFASYNKASKDGLRYEVPLAAPTGSLAMIQRSDGSHDVYWMNATAVVQFNVPRKISNDYDSCLPFPPNIILYPSHLTGIGVPADDKTIHQKINKSFLKKPCHQIPRSLVALDTLLLLLFDEALVVVSTIIGKEIECFPLSTSMYGQIIHVIKDSFSGTLWLYSADAIYMLTLHNDSEDLWRLHLIKGDIDTALAHVTTKAQRNNLCLKAANEYMAKSRYVDAAKMYANIDSNICDFETVCINFIQKRRLDATIEYLMRKKANLHYRPTDPQYSILTLWLLEMILYRLGELEMEIAATIQLNGDVDEMKKRHQQLQGEYFKIVATIKNNSELTQPVNFLLSTIGCQAEFEHFATTRDDLSSLVVYKVTNADLHGAIQVLNKMPLDEKKQNLIQRFGPLLSSETGAFSSSLSGIDVCTHLPILLLSLFTRDADPSIRNSIHVLKSIMTTRLPLEPFGSLVANVYIILMCNLDDESVLLGTLTSFSSLDVDKLDWTIALRYLKRKQTAPNGEKWIIPYIHLQSLCGMHMEALELALEIGNLDVAKICANRPNCVYTKRRLWHKILHYSANTLQSTEACIATYQESGGNIKVYSILEMLDSDTPIEVLEPLVEKHLSDTQAEMQSMEKEIESMCKNIKLLKTKIQESSKRTVSLSVDQPCAKCKINVFTKDFIVFPCAHAFHKTCLLQSHLNLKSGDDLAELKQLKQRCESKRDPEASARLTHILQESCVLCGHLVLLQINKPFVTAEDAEELEKWAIN